ncbi:MAG: hypothetical protein G3M78_08045 [Candidatus Nitrohelix vancouverensis]|uniref:Uncharacterized protein n=1 Tax=Candidatus Nitrohelix vancouverensis TaxID=2705534 RepID=A0A7T0G3G7_9BACT|nr:MAG: hypothetical protein G3M78_08045 [Candidatus Nitrohelix vancouverensis]
MNEKDEMIAEELSLKIREMMEHGDPELQEMIRETVRGLHNYMMDNPKSLADMKSQEKNQFLNNLIQFPGASADIDSPPEAISHKDDATSTQTETPKIPEKKPSKIIVILSGVIFGILSFLLFSEEEVSLKASDQGVWCAVKGNVNAKGEKIFHLPGDKWYDKTTINESTDTGERWFCSAEDAKQAGFRRALS